jgi:hypothetical protein
MIGPAVEGNCKFQTENRVLIFGLCETSGWGSLGIVLAFGPTISNGDLLP